METAIFAVKDLGNRELDVEVGGSIVFPPVGDVSQVDGFGATRHVKYHHFHLSSHT
jgi:hypothetical protein